MIRISYSRATNSVPHAGHRIASDLIENHPAQDGENDAIHTATKNKLWPAITSSNPRDMNFLFTFSPFNPPDRSE